ncbi:MAG TPA: hypothetical protein VEW48_26075 [Thermoanaerobaculia bacterium]|nr:hypothetical protein [Thermoanaerobaculia bacterium]
MSAPPEIVYDRAGFPLVWVEEIRSHIHWLPVTKIQLEHFLCEVGDSAFDAAWYDRILELNPRVSPREINERNYWKAFATGLRPAEAERFARWCGEDYALPTTSEWFAAYRALRDRSVSPPDWNGALQPRVRTLLARVREAWSRAGQNRSLPDTRAGHMLMRLGVLEWVEDAGNGQRWGGVGLPHPDFHGVLTNPDHGMPMRPLHPETDRLFYYGFRLVRREAS